MSLKVEMSRLQKELKKAKLESRFVHGSTSTKALHDFIHKLEADIKLLVDKIKKDFDNAVRLSNIIDTDHADAVRNSTLTDE